MSTLLRAVSRFLARFRRDDLDRDFESEAQIHVDLATEDYVQRGVAPAEARRLARARFGSVASSRDAHRDARGLPWMDELLFDLRFMFRGWRRDRGFTAAVLLILTLAIGLNVTVFTIVQAMLYRGMPLVTRGDRLVFVQFRKPSTPWGVPFDEFSAWREQTRALEGVSYMTGNRPVTYRDEHGPPLEMGFQRITANSFGLLGVKPMLGRDFVPGDESPSAGRVAILSYPFWESRFGLRPDIIGTSIRIDDQLVTVVGVMPRGFTFVYDQNLWMPLERSLTDTRLAFGFMVFGRLRDGVSVEQARTEIETIHLQLADQHESIDRALLPTVLTYAESHVGPDAKTIYGSLWVGAWFVLLIACANVANLMLVRTMRRWREFATRLALGAGQWRIMRQMLLESLMLGTVAGAFGWLITNAVVPRWADATRSRYLALDHAVDGQVLRYLVWVSVATALLVSLAPMLRVLQLGSGGALKGDARGVTRSLRGKHLSSAMVAGQMALAIVLLAGAGVLVRSLLNIVSAETGVHAPERVFIGAVRLPPDAYMTGGERHAYFDRLRTDLSAIPGVEQVAFSGAPVAIGAGFLRAVEVDGRPGSPEEARMAQVLTAGIDYFTLVGTPIMTGRDFDTRDGMDDTPVAIVNQRFAELFWPRADPIGQRLRTAPGTAWRTVVGIAPNIMQGDPLRQQFKPLVYVPFAQEPTTRAWNRAGCCFRGTNFAIRSNQPLEMLADRIRATLQKGDPNVTLEEFLPLTATFAFNRDLMDLEHAELGKNAALAPVFAIVALFLAAIGLYAVIAHSVNQRTKEIGVRMAIGAAAHDIRRLVFLEGMMPVALGLLIGLVASLGVNQVLRSQLVGVSPYDPLTLTTAPLALLVVAFLACHVPSRRAIRVDPVVALQDDQG